MMDNLRLFGRYTKEKEHILFGQPLGGFELRVSGGVCSAVLGGEAYGGWDGIGSTDPVFSVFEDGEPDPRRAIPLVVERGAPREYRLSDGARAVRVVKRSESVFSKCRLYGVRVADGELLPPDRARRPQFALFGDSITCGYGVDAAGADGEVFSTLTEDACKSFGALAAAAFGAEPSALAVSGWCMNRGRAGKDGIPPWLHYADVNSAARWDFAGRPLDVAVICLGVNDGYYICEAGIGAIERERRLSAYEASYEAFLQELFAAHPRAAAVCCYGFFSEAVVAPSVRRVAERFAAAGKAITALRVPPAYRFGFGLHGHPHFAGQLAAAEKLTEEIERLTGLKRIRRLSGEVL